MDISTFEKNLIEKKIVLTPKQLQQFEAYFDLLIIWNEKMNLTSITEKKEVYRKHFYDSITPAFFVSLSNYQTICDVGSGAGFPGIPLKIIFPHLRISLVDSLAKRISFLQEVIQVLELSDTHAIHERVEDFGNKNMYRESFDVVTARAVANLSVLSEYCLPLVKVDGIFLALKGGKGKEEASTSSHAIEQLGGKISEMYDFHLPGDSAEERTIIKISKVKATPNRFPRRAGTAAKDPL